jgi:glutamate/tyrosine decarboxylase-like PLP-dependent enzyme
LLAVPAFNRVKEKIMLHKKKKLDELENLEKGHASTYSMRYFNKPIPKYEIPAEEMSSNAAYQLVHDE